MDYVSLAVRQLGGRSRLGGEFHGFRLSYRAALGKHEAAVSCCALAIAAQLKIPHKPAQIKHCAASRSSLAHK